MALKSGIPENSSLHSYIEVFVPSVGGVTDAVVLNSIRIKTSLYSLLEIAVPFLEFRLFFRLRDAQMLPYDQNQMLIYLMILIKAASNFCFSPTVRVSTNEMDILGPKAENPRRNISYRPQMIRDF